VACNGWFQSTRLANSCGKAANGWTAYGGKIKDLELWEKSLVNDKLVVAHYSAQAAYALHQRGMFVLYHLVRIAACSGASTDEGTASTSYYGEQPWPITNAASF
jgi:hypothetical protein